ncbi:MFS general substrate transporter [Mycena rebaudengoi]|nr:MFS general substrate transporter [Mycena rebaudengoi]
MPPTERNPVVLDSSVRRKVDIRLIPLITILYLCCFLDRSNLGTSPGMEVDLELSGIRYQLASAAFFITYSLLEIPCNVVLKLLRPSIWIPSITLAWGITMVSMAFVTSYQGLIIARLFLGVAEAGLAPALGFCITLWYSRDEQARPLACYFSAATLAGAFGGLLSFSIEKMDGLGGLHGWSWIFLLEGLITVLVAFVAFGTMIDYPSTANFLTSKEREHLLDVLRLDSAGEPSHFKMRFVWKTLQNPRSWLQTLIYVGATAPLYSFTLFLPTIIHALGFSATHAQLLTIPPYAVGCLSTIVFGVLSDRTKTRGLFVTGLSALGLVGYAMLLATGAPSASYAACVLISGTVFPIIPIIVVWSAGNAGGSLMKAVVIGQIGMVGNLGGICASFIYRTQDTPRFRLGHSVAMGFLCIACAGSIFATWMYKRLNEAKVQQCTRQNIAADRKAEFGSLGVASPLFRYAL